MGISQKNHEKRRQRTIPNETRNEKDQMSTENLREISVKFSQNSTLSKMPKLRNFLTFYSLVERNFLQNI